MTLARANLPMLIPPSVLADAVLHTNSDGIVASDKDGIIQFWNPGAERIFGYTSVDAIGKSLDIIIPERLRARSGTRRAK